MELDDPSREPSIETDLAVLRALSGSRPATAVELADRVNEDPVTVDQVCYRLQREGSVRVDEHGAYALTPDGSSRLRSHRLSRDAR